VGAGLLGGLAVLIALRVFVFELYRVTSPSMVPTLLVGDWLLVDKVTHHDPIQRGDVIVFRRPEDAVASVKRVLGVPGDTVALSASAFTLNGVPVFRAYVGEASFDASGDQVSQAVPFPDDTLFEERIGERVWVVAQGRQGDQATGSWKIEAGTLFVAGDNRDASRDSRDPTTATVHVADVVGRVVRIVGSSGPRGIRPRGWLPVP